MRHRALLSTLTALCAGVVLSGTPASAFCGGPGFFGASPEDVAAAETAAFTEADANGDGKLTPTEFATFADLMRQKLESLRFAKLDTDGDGLVSKAELDAGRPTGHGGRHHRDS